MNKEEFIQAYDARKQFAYALHERRCHRGKAPNLMTCLVQFGPEATFQVIEGLITDFISFTPARTRMTKENIRQLTLVLCTQFKSMKITQLILFFVKAKSGFFGKFYTNIEPMDITIALRSWVEVCDKELSEFYYERAHELEEDELNEQRKSEKAIRDQYDALINNSSYFTL